MAKKLETYKYDGFKLGYNNYDGSKSSIEKNEFAPPSRNAMPTGKGSVKKAPGATRFGGQVNAGNSVQSGVQFVTTTIDRLIVHSGTLTKYYNAGSWTTMTGLTLSASHPAYFCQALDRLYCSQEGLGALYVSTDGATWSSVSNGRELISMVFFNQRLYGIDPTTGYIWFSNPFTTVASPPSVSLGNFATYDTSLPTKNAGFIQFAPGSGVIPTVLFYDSASNAEALYAYTKRHGYWKIAPVSTANSDGSINHSILQSNGYFGSPAPKSIAKVGNDQWFYDGEMLNSNGEVALYQNIRVVPKFGKLKGDLDGINPTYSALPALGFKDNVVYFAYPTGTYNDRVIAYDTVLGAPGSPQSGFNCAFFLLYQDGATKRLLYGSSNASDSYVYEMASGTDIGSSAVDFLFVPQSTNCGHPGLVKRLAKARVYYTTVFGTLDYRVIFEETRDLTGSVQIGESATRPSSLGIQSLGSAPLGQDYILGSALTSLATNSYFEIDTEFEAFERVTVELSNAVSGEQAQIDDIEYLYVPGSQFEILE